MSFSYTAGSGTDKDRVRMLIGDTDSSVAEQQRLEDEEVDDFLSIYGGYRSAAPFAAEALAAKFARMATEKGMGQANLVWERFRQLIALAKQLRSSVALLAVPFVGGISQSRRNTNDADTDLVQPAFRRGMLDHDRDFSVTTTSTAA